MSRIPAGALTDAGLSHISPAQLTSVASSVVPEIALTPGDPGANLVQAVAQSHTAATFPSSTTELVNEMPVDTEASHNDTEVHDNTTQLGSHNLTELASPKLSFGDFIVGDKNSASGDGAVAISGTSSGAIVSGEGAMLGDGNEAHTGDLQTGSNSNIAYGQDSRIGQENVTRHEDTDIEIHPTAVLTPTLTEYLDQPESLTVPYDDYSAATPAFDEDVASPWSPPTLDFL